MKKIFFLIIILSSIKGYTQTLEENKTDEFTKAIVKRSSWEKLVFTKKMKDFHGFTCYFRFSRIDTSYFMDIKIMLRGGNKVFSIDDKAKIMLKLSNDSIYTLYNLSYQISSLGKGAIGFAGSQGMGIQTSYISISDKKMAMLEEYYIKKIRIYTNDGYVESDVIDEYSSLVISAIKLLR